MRMLLALFGVATILSLSGPAVHAQTVVTETYRAPVQISVPTPQPRLNGASAQPPGVVVPSPTVFVPNPAFVVPGRVYRYPIVPPPPVITYRYPVVAPPLPYVVAPRVWYYRPRPLVYGQPVRNAFRLVLP